MKIYKYDGTVTECDSIEFSSSGDKLIINECEVMLVKDVVRIANSTPKPAQLKVIDMFERDFWRNNGDVDVYNDVTDEQTAAYCGQVKLTEKAKQKFERALNCDIDVVCSNITPMYNYVIVHVDCFGDDWETVWNEIDDLFNAAAGYCTEDEYDELFEEVDY